MNYTFSFPDSVEYVLAYRAIVNAGLLDETIVFDYVDATITVSTDAAWESIDRALKDAGVVRIEGDDDDEHDQFRSDAEADADVLASAGMGTDEDYERCLLD
jgi:hypothetical protein